MRQTLAFLAIAVILLPATKLAAAPHVPGVGDRLSLSITNKYGDVLANPTVAQILSDGLILERGALEMKVKYADLPASVRQTYQPLAAGVVKKEKKEGAAAAAYVAYTQQWQAEQAQHLAAQEAQENEQASRTKDRSTGVAKYLDIPIPNQNWKLTILNLGFSDWNKQQDNNQFVLRGLPGPSGFNLVLFVEEPVNNLPGNDPVYNFYWSNMAHDSLIDAQSVKAERKDKFIEVSYTAHGQPNANYFFAYRGKWVDVHLSKAAAGPDDDKLFAEFDNALSYGQ
jgi:hypothetical protein